MAIHFSRVIDRNGEKASNQETFDRFRANAAGA